MSHRLRWLFLLFVCVLEHEHTKENHDEAYDDRPRSAEVRLGCQQQAQDSNHSQEQCAEYIFRAAFAAVVSK